MTTKDYVKIAEGLNRMAILLAKRPGDDTSMARKATFIQTVNVITNVLAEDNVQFDRSKFSRAVYFIGNL